MPIPEREKLSCGPGPVITYKLSPEELERYRKGSATVTKKLGVKERLAKSDLKREVKRMSTQQESAKTPSKEEVLRHIAAGKSVYKIEKEMGFSPGTIRYWLNKWNLKGIKPDLAKQLLDEMVLDGVSPSESTVKDNKHEETAEKLTEQDNNLEQVPQDTEEIKRLQQELARVIGERNHFRELYEQVEAENMQLREEREALLKTVEKAIDGDPVNHPAHYTAGRVECIDAIESATVGLTGGLAYNTGAAIKYLWRWSRKGGIQDLQKARWCVDRLIGEVSQDGNASIG